MLSDPKRWMWGALGGCSGAVGLLLLYGFGTMVGPVAGAALMDWLRPESLFLATAMAHILLAAYAMMRIRRRAPVPQGAKDAFKTLPADRAVTPEATRLDPRTKPAT